MPVKTKGHLRRSEGIFDEVEECYTPMTNDPEPPISPAAKRMRRHRELRRDGLRCLTIQLHETEIDVLICKGLLKPEKRQSKNAIINALHTYFDLTFI
jgi:hypothetical protein